MGTPYEGRCMLEGSSPAHTEGSAGDALEGKGLAWVTWAKGLSLDRTRRLHASNSVYGRVTSDVDTLSLGVLPRRSGTDGALLLLSIC